ncbi:MAG: flagellar hook-basal body complex protein [Butyrivibrio sp.]|nr:flagellar hook-basal body complex protein [Butyrivibrio sp.]MBR1642532.1 flagellar hook-basal body complex protein [Butyrivibrio sp.]
MMRSLYSGVAGLRTHQTKMDVLGNNIANVNTTSYKSQSITFSDLMYQTTQTASGATATKGGVNARQIGLGAKSGAISTAIESQGATQTTNNPFDIMITGDSFFIVNNGKENLYTRDGSFYIDGAGNLAMQSNGYFVQGWVAQEDKETGEIRVNKNGGLSPLQIMSADNSTYSPASTTAALYSGNIDDHDTNVTSDDGKTITLEFYDNKGYLYTGKFTLKDTGTEHLFSLQLTDIIDSDGNSINKTVTLPDGTTTKVLDNVTFGNVASTDPAPYAEGYTVTVVDGVATIKQDANTIKYPGVPSEGNLKDLMGTTYSSKQYAGVLQEAYLMSDDDVISKLQSNYSSATYSINESTGLLTITWTESDQYQKSANFSYATSVNNSYYYDSTTGLGYRVPLNKTNVESGSLSEYDKQAFTQVFKNSGGTAPAIDANHLYSFDGTTLTISDKVGLATKDADTQVPISELTSYADNFTASGTYDDLATVLGNTTDPVYYTFDGTNLVVKENFVVSEKDIAKKVDFAGNSNIEDASYVTNKVYSIDDLDSAISAAGKTSILQDYYGTSYGSQTITDFITDSGYTNFAVKELTGTYAILFYSNTPTNTVGEKIYEGSVATETYTADTTAYPKTSSDKFTGMWYSSTLGYDYMVRDDQRKIADFSEQMLTSISNMTNADYAKYADVTNSVKFNNSKVMVDVTKNDTIEASQADAVVYPSYNQENKNFDFLTKNPQTIWTVPADDMKGNITDLLSASSGKYKNLLNTVYGITDADARAYGTDGSYVINNDGTITLSTGDKTVNLLFDAANGSLTSANGAGNGLVDIMFKQEIPGLEAFGYQQGANDDGVPGHLTVDFSTVTNYNTSGSSTVKAVKGDKKSLNTGRAVGEMNGVNISTDGQIYATYSNGQTKLLGQIASAQFANASGLSKEGDNLYSSTLNSGEATVQDITTDGGYMNTGVLEMSNVDLSREFTEMITTQRGFQANSRIITVSDTLLEELTNLKR